MKCPYCSTSQSRCATTTGGRSISECTNCGRVVEERQTQPHHLFHLRAQDSPLYMVTPDLNNNNIEISEEEEEDPFQPTGFISTFSTWSLEPNPLSAITSLSFSGHLAELERALESSSSSSVAVDNLRAYLQIIDVVSILRLDYEISDHAFQLFRDCCSATCLRNRSIEALATAALVQAIREAQEPRTLQEISIAANVPQKEIGKYIKILGEALQLCQPLNSNSISVHMPRFCTLLQLNKSAQELATHIGEVVINKCFCTRRNPISISAAAIYLACQLEDKRKTQAEICKVTGLTEVTLRKVYKELLENWDDLLPSNYTPAVPPEKAFPTTSITSGRSLGPKIDLAEIATSLEKEKDKPRPNDVLEACRQARGKEDTDAKGNPFWPPQFHAGSSTDKNHNLGQGIVDKDAKMGDTCSMKHKDVLQQKVIEKDSQMDDATPPTPNGLIQSVDKETKMDDTSPSWPFRHPLPSGSSPFAGVIKTPKLLPGYRQLKSVGIPNGDKIAD